MLAESVNMKMPERAALGEIDSSETKRRQEALKIILKEAAIHYHNNLVSSDNLAKSYLKNRNIGQNIIKQFGLGYSKDFSTVINHLEKLGHSKQDMKYAGLIGQKADTYYDNFAYRLIVPIIDDKGAVRGFGGRILKDEDFAKYKNSPQNDIFDKSEILFGANLVKKRKQRVGLPYVIIVEGYMDAIALHNAGFDMTIASMGTALTTKQAKEIRLLLTSPNQTKFLCYISFDGDTSGQKATLKSLDILAAAGLNVRVISLPDKLDPDDVINKHGADYYEQLRKNSLELTAYKLEILKKDHDLSTPGGKSSYALAATNIIKRLENRIEREEYLKVVQKFTGYTMQVLYTQADLHIQDDAPPVPFRPYETKAGEKLTEAKEFILASIIANKPYAGTRPDMPLLLEDSHLQRVYNIIADCLKADIAQGGKGEWSAKAWAEFYQIQAGNYSEAERNTITRLGSYQHIEGDGADKYNKILDTLEKDLIDKKILNATEEFERTKDIKLLEKIRTLQQEKRELK